MNNYFNRMFWGLVLIFFDINLGKIDIMPNIIGAIMVATSIDNLSDKEESFKKGRPFAWLVVGNTALATILKFININIQNSNIEFLWSVGFSLFSMIISLINMFFICNGIANMGKSRGFSDIISDAQSRWYFLFINTCLSSLLMAFTINFKNNLNSILFIFLITGMVANILILVLVRRAAKLFIDN